jgi:hypothetical protein
MIFNGIASSGRLMRNKLSDKERFFKIVTGEYRVVFESMRQPEPTRKDNKPDAASLAAALIERGVTQTTATQTVTVFQADRIKNQLEVFDWLVSQKDPKVSRNPAGFLVASIKSEYAPPKGFMTQTDEADRQARAFERKRRTEERERAIEAREQTRIREQQNTIEEFWASLSDKESVGVSPHFLHIPLTVADESGSWSNASNVLRKAKSANSED